MKKSEAPARPEPLREGLDYYIEDGFWVFTEQFLRKRGYCCGNGCRHCPYKESGGSSGCGSSNKQ